MIYTLRNDYINVEILDIGCTILSLEYLKDEEWIQTTIRYEDDSLYHKNNPYFLNCITGPHAGRIKDGKFTYDNGIEVKLDTNDGNNHLHGGKDGYHKLVFELVKYDNPKLVLRALDDRGSIILVSFQLSGKKLSIDYDVEVNHKGVYNLTHHTYFNLGNEPTVLDHELQISATKYATLDYCDVPNKLVDVEGPFDIRKKSKIRDKLNDKHPQLQQTEGIDHPFFVDEWPIVLESSESGIGLEVTSNRPYVIIYTGNKFDDSVRLHQHGPAVKYGAIAIEPQYLPNDINLGLGESQVYHKGEKYRQHINYKFYNI